MYLYSSHMFQYIFCLEAQWLIISDFFPLVIVEHLRGKRKRTRAGKCENDLKGRTIKIDSPKQTNCLTYNSDISPVTQRRVWSATNHRKWQSGLRWYNKQVQITVMNIRERGVAAGCRFAGRKIHLNEQNQSNIHQVISALCQAQTTSGALEEHWW